MDMEPNDGFSIVHGFRAIPTGEPIGLGTRTSRVQYSKFCTPAILTDVDVAHTLEIEHTNWFPPVILFALTALQPEQSELHFTSWRGF